MTRQLGWLTGRPEQLRVLAETLTGSASRLSAVNATLMGLRVESAWESDSGRAFAAAADEPPPVIARVVERYVGAAGALRTLADELDVIQAEVSAVLPMHKEGWRRHDLFMERLGFATDPVEQQDLERSIHAELVVIDEAERRHARACRDHEEADRRCARVLRTLAQDAIDDPTGYTWLTNTRKVTKWTTLGGMKLPYVGKFVGLASGVIDAGADVALLLIYDEGSWKSVGSNILSTAVAATGNSMIAGSGLGVTASVTGGRRVFTQTGAPSTGYRLGAGGRQTFDKYVNVWRGALGLPVRTVGPKFVPKPLSQAITPVDRAGNALRSKVDAAVLEGWERATASGPAAQRMFVAGTTLKHAPSAVEKGLDAKGRLGDRREQHERRAREQAARGSW